MSDPYCLAMVLCDGTHRDPATGKVTILGTFSTVTAKTYPTPVAFCVYSAVTDAIGEFTLKFQVVDSRHGFDAENEPIFSVEIVLNSPSPLAVSEGSMFVKGLVIQDPGVYHCELLHEGDVLMSRRLVAIKQVSADGGDKENDN